MKDSTVHSIVSTPCAFIRTIHPIPRQSKSFRWEVKIIEGEDFRIGIGLGSRLPVFGHGFPHKHDKHMIGVDLCNNEVTSGVFERTRLQKNFSNGDVISFHLQYMENDGVQYSVCHLFINGTQIGIYLQPVSEMYPLMWMAEGNKVIETNLTGENYSYTEGNQFL